MFYSQKLPGKRGQVLGMDGGQCGVEEGCIRTQTLEQIPRESQGPR